MFVFMKENLELKSHYILYICLKLNPYATGAACFSQFSQLDQKHSEKNR